MKNYQNNRFVRFLEFILHFLQAANKAGISIDVRGILDTWILQMNYPVVMVTKSASEKIMLQQKRFLSNPNAVDPGKYHSPYKKVFLK